MSDTLNPPLCLHNLRPPPVFSSLAVATGNQADSRGSLISVDSNPSNSDRNSEKMDGCEKVRKKNYTSHHYFIEFGSYFFHLFSRVNL